VKGKLNGMTIELFLDTSTDKGLVALWKEGVLVEERLLKAGPFSSSALFPALREFLIDHQVGLRDIQRFSAGTGPGSFTGLRVAVSVQQTLAFSLGLRWEGISSLCLWTPTDPGHFVAMVDARSGGIYCQAACWDEDSFQIVTPATRLSVDEAVALAQEHNGRIATPSAAPLRARLPSGLWIEEVNPSTQRSFSFVARDPSPVIRYGSTLTPQQPPAKAACSTAPF
jgi:tRNA threonylcarbamoyladenosine biosynthesis protein TsaB